jgi:hypothetical protein
MAKCRIRDEETDDVMPKSDDLYEDLRSKSEDHGESSEINYTSPTPPEQRNLVTAPIACISVMTQRQVMTSRTRVIVTVV